MKPEYPGRIEGRFGKLVHIEMDVLVASTASAGMMASKRENMARPTDWHAWLKRVGAAVDPVPGVRFESSALAYEAASLDIGVAIATKVFVNRHLQAGSFIAPFDMTCYSGEGYYLTWPKNISPSLPLQKFLVWMREQIGEEEHS